MQYCISFVSCLKWSIAVIDIIHIVYKGIYLVCSVKDHLKFVETTKNKGIEKSILIIAQIYALTISTNGTVGGNPRFGNGICGIISIASLPSTMSMMGCF